MNDQRPSLTLGFSLGRYEVCAVRGFSETGIEYLAHDQDGGGDVAIQEFLPGSVAVRNGASAVEPILPANAGEFDTMLGAFLEEAAALAQCDSPNINAIRDILRANGTGYVVADSPDGVCLDELLKGNGAVASEVLDLMLPSLLDGLGKLHETGLLHLDIRPGNIVLRADGSAILRGFGAVPMGLGSARQTFSASRSKRRSVTVRSEYAPIELYSENTAPGPWSDIYALGATLHHCVTGSAPPPVTDRVLTDSPTLPVGNPKSGFDSKMLSAIEAATAIVPTARPRSIIIWRNQFFGRTPTGEGAGADARFARAAARGGRLSPNADAHKRAVGDSRTSGVLRWSVPALTLTAATAAIAFIDVGVLRPELDSSDVEPSLTHLAMAGRTEAAIHDAGSGDDAVGKPEASPADDAAAAAETGATLVVDTVPPDVEVFIAGRAVGRSPLHLPGLPEGIHDVTLRHPHYETVELNDQQFVATEELRIESALQRGAGDLLVTSDPPGAWVEIDGERVLESTPGTVRGLPSGPLVVKLGAPGRAMARAAVEVPKGGTGYLARILPIAYGRLEIDLEPADAQVVLSNDTGIAYSYNPRMRLPQGSYSLEVSKQGYRQANRAVSINGNTEIRVELRPRS